MLTPEQKAKRKHAQVAQVAQVIKSLTDGVTVIAGQETKIKTTIAETGGGEGRERERVKKTGGTDAARPYSRGTDALLIRARSRCDLPDVPHRPRALHHDGSAQRAFGENVGAMREGAGAKYKKQSTKHKG